MKQLLSYFPALALAFFGVARVANAQAPFANPLDTPSLELLILAVVEAIVYMGTLVLVIALVFVGYLFVAAQGNAEALGKARTALVYTVAGGLILLGAEAITYLIESTAQSI
jgi:hypothetical protein